MSLNLDCAVISGKQNIADFGYQLNIWFPKDVHSYGHVFDYQKRLPDQ